MISQNTQTIQIGNVFIGGKSPISIQSMTNTATENVEETVKQILELAEAGSQMIRFTINDINSAQAVPKITELVRKKSTVPLIGDFHFNGNILLKKVPECAKLLDKYRINPGNTSDKNFQEMCEIAIKNKKPIRIGVNAGSLDSEVLNTLTKKNNQRKTPLTTDEIFVESMVESCLKSAQLAEKIGLQKNQIVLSGKVSQLQLMISVYEKLAKKSNYCLHLGLTEAGGGDFGMIQSSVALGILLQQGIGDTFRVSLTPEPNTKRTKEVKVAQMILQSLELKNFRPKVISCPGCGRTSSDFFQKLAQSVNNKVDQNISIWKQKYKGIENLKIAVMGCVVNGPGESQHCNIGISLPGRGENFAVVFQDGKKFCNLKEDNIENQFLEILENYLEQKYL